MTDEEYREVCWRRSVRAQRRCGGLIHGTSYHGLSIAKVDRMVI
jgi:hypothetical protein